MCENRGLDSQGFNLNFPAVPTSGTKRELPPKFVRAGDFGFRGSIFGFLHLGFQALHLKETRQGGGRGRGRGRGGGDFAFRSSIFRFFHWAFRSFPADSRWR